MAKRKKKQQKQNKPYPLTSAQKEYARQDNQRRMAEEAAQQEAERRHAIAQTVNNGRQSGTTTLQGADQRGVQKTGIINGRQTGLTTQQGAEQAQLEANRNPTPAATKKAASIGMPAVKIAGNTTPAGKSGALQTVGSTTAGKSIGNAAAELVRRNAVQGTSAMPVTKIAGNTTPTIRGNSLMDRLLYGGGQSAAQKALGGNAARRTGMQAVKIAGNTTPAANRETTAEKAKKLDALLYGDSGSAAQRIMNSRQGETQRPETKIAGSTRPLSGQNENPLMMGGQTAAQYAAGRGAAQADMTMPGAKIAGAAAQGNKETRGEIRDDINAWYNDTYLPNQRANEMLGLLNSYDSDYQNYLINGDTSEMTAKQLADREELLQGQLSKIQEDIGTEYNSPAEKIMDLFMGSAQKKVSQWNQEAIEKAGKLNKYAYQAEGKNADPALVDAYNYLVQNEEESKNEIANQDYLKNLMDKYVNWRRNGYDGDPVMETILDNTSDETWATFEDLMEYLYYNEASGRYGPTEVNDLLYQMQNEIGQKMVESIGTGDEGYSANPDVEKVSDYYTERSKARYLENEKNTTSMYREKRENVEAMEAEIGAQEYSGHYNDEIVMDYAYSQMPDNYDFSEADWVKRLPDDNVYKIYENVNEKRLQPGSPYYWMTDEQVDNFNKFMTKAYENGTSPAEAQAYLDGLMPFLNKKRADNRDQNLKALADTAWAPAVSVGTTAMKIAGGIPGTIGTALAIFGDNNAKDPNSDWYALTKMAETYQNARGDVVGRDTAKALTFLPEETAVKLGKSAYNIGMETMRNTMEFGIAKGLGSVFQAAGMAAEPAMELAGNLALDLMGMETVSSTMIKDLESGMHPVEAGLMALGAGYITKTSERLPFEHRLNFKVENMTGGLKSILPEIIGAATEEGFESIAETFGNSILDSIDSAITSRQGEVEAEAAGKYYQDYWEYKLETGMEPTDAWKNEHYRTAMKDATINAWRQNIEDWTTEAISGGFMRGGQMAAQSIGTNVRGAKYRNNGTMTNRAGKTADTNVRGTAEERTQALIDIGKAMKPDTASYANAMELEARMKAGKKISNFQLGKTIENIMREGSEQIRADAKSAAVGVVKEGLMNNGVEADEAESLADIVVKARTQGITALNRTETKALQGNELAYRVYTAMTEPAGLQENRRLDRKAGEIAGKAHLETTKKTLKTRTNMAIIDATMEGKDVIGATKLGADPLREARKAANTVSDEIYQAATGEKTGKANEAVISIKGADGTMDNVVATVEGFRDGKVIVKTADGTTREMKPAEVALHNADAAALLEYRRMYDGIISDDVAGKAIAALAATPDPSGNFMRDVVKVNFAAKFGESMPENSLGDVADEIYRTAAAEALKAEEGRVKNNAKLKAGEGRATWDGAEVGTEEWNRKAKEKGISEATQAEAEYVAEYAKLKGLDVRFVYNDSVTTVTDADGNKVEKQTGKGTYGFYNGDDGSITINLAGENADGTPHSLIATISHEITHLLEQNSPEMYKELKAFVLKTLRESGVNLENRVQNTIDHYNQFYKESGTNEKLSLDGAIYEMVANGCDQIMGSAEFANQLKNENRSLYEKIRDYVKNALNTLSKAISGRSLFGSSTLESQQTIGRVNEIAKIWNIALDEVMGRDVQKEAKKGTGESLSIRDNIVDYTQPVRQQLIDYTQLTESDKKATNKVVLFGTTPQNLIRLGLVKLPMTMNFKHVGYMLEGNYKEDVYKDDHIFDIETLSNLDHLIENPVAIIKDSKPGAIKVLVEMKAKSGKNAVVPISINAQKTINSNRFDVNNLETAYGQYDVANELKAAIEKDSESDPRLYYVDSKKTQRIISALQGNLPERLTIPEGFIRNIPEKDLIVNDKKYNRKKPIKNQTDTIQFENWFGDSKVINKDGSPKIMYHGTTEQFEAFDKKKAKSSGAWGKGFYFTDELSHAGHYGNALAVYLRAENPLTEGNHNIKESQMRRFIEAVANSEDYDLDNYGYGATVESVLKSVYTGKSDLAMINDVNATAIGDMAEAIRIFNEVNKTKYDSVITDKETVVYDPNQIKSATDNVGTFGRDTDKINYSIQQSDADYEAALKDRNIVMANAIIKIAAKRNGFYTDEIAYHGTDSFGFTVFDMPESQGQIFVSFTRMLSRTYTNRGDVQKIGKDYAKMNLQDASVERLEKELNDYIYGQDNDSALYHFTGAKGYTSEQYHELVKNELADIREMAKGDKIEGRLGNLLDRIMATDRNGDYDTQRKLSREIDSLKRETNNEGLENKLTKFNYYIMPGYLSGQDVFRLDVNNEAGNPYYLSRDKAIQQLKENSRESGGLYQFYTRPGKQLVVNAEDNNWDSIPWYNVMLADKNAKGQYPETARTSPRAIATWAKEHGYDSVRINNVNDHGGRQFFHEGSGYGDIGIFFNPSDVKSADIVTYDDDGNIIPPSERFNDSEQDIRWSILNSGDMDVNEWMMTVSETALQTEAEKELLRDYKGLRLKLSLDMEKQRNLQNRISALESKESLTKEENRQLQGLNIRLQNAKTAQATHEAELAKVTGDEGYMRMMYGQQRVMNDFVQGRTQDEVLASISRMEDTAEKAKADIEKQAAELEALAKDKAVQEVQSRINKVSLDRMAAWLRKTYGSNINKGELMNELAKISLKMHDGQDYAADVEDLAGRIMEKIPGEGGEYLDMLRGMTIKLGPGQVKELYGSNSSMKELRSMLAGTGVKVVQSEKGGLDANWDELCDMIPVLDRNTNEKDQVGAMLDFITSQKNAGQANGRTQYAEHLAEMMENVEQAAMAVDVGMVTDPAAKKQIAKLQDIILDLSGRTEDAAKRMREMGARMDELIAKGKKAAGWTATMRRDVNSAIEYFDKTAKMAMDKAKQNKQSEIIAQLKDKHTQEMLKKNDEWRNLIERDRQARIQAENNGARRRQMATIINRLNKLLASETDQQNIPEKYKGMAREMLRTFVENDLGGGSRHILNGNFKSLANTKRLLDIWEKQDGPFDLGELSYEGTDDEKAIAMNVLDDFMTIYDALEEWNGKYNGKNKLDTLQQMGETLKRMQDAVNEIYSIIQNARTMDINGRKIQISEMAIKFMEGLKNSRFKGEMTSKAGKAAAALKRMAITGNITPEYFFRELKNAGLDEIWNEFKRAENRNGLEISKARARLAEIAEKHGYKSWDTKEKHRIQTENGVVEMTTEQLMALWATWKREQKLNPEMSTHLENGGFYVEDESKGKGIAGRKKDNAKPHPITPEQMYEAGKQLTDEQKAYVDDVVGFLSKDMSELGNEASMRMYGIKKYKEDYYFPMKQWKGVGNFRSDKGSTAATTENRAAHKGWTKRRINQAKNALEIGDFTKLAVAHTVEMINYNTMAPSIEAMNKMLNWQDTEFVMDRKYIHRNMRAVFGQEYGQDALKYLETLMSDLNGGVAQDPRGTAMDKLLSIFKKNAVAGSMSVALQQPLSYIRAANMISPKYLAAALNPATWKGSYAEMMEHSGVAVIKEMGRFDMGYGASAKEYVTPEGYRTGWEKTKEGISDAATMLPELMDRMTWTRMWSAVKAEQHKLHPDMDMKSDEFLDMVGERFNEVMRRTQVYDSTLVKSSNMRSKNFALKSLTSFMAEPTLSLNLLRDAALNVKGEKGIRKAAMAAGTFLLSAIAQASVKGLMGAGRNPDEKKTQAENFLYRFAYNILGEANPLGLIPGYSDLIEVLTKGELTDDSMTAIGKLYSIIQTIQKADGNTNVYRLIEDTGAQLAQLFTGVPAKNIMRDARAMMNWFAPRSGITEIMGGKPYALRGDSGAIIKYQTIDTMMNQDLIGMVNAWLGDAGYQTNNTAYYKRIYEAKKAGDEQTAAEIREYLVEGKGAKEKAIDSAVAKLAKQDEDMSAADTAQFIMDEGKDPTAYITQQLKKGEISKEDAARLYKEQNPKLTDDDIYWKIDRIEYGQENGIENVNGTYYRLWDAMDANKAEQISGEIKTMTEHGVQVKNIKSQITKEYKADYLAADSDGKRRIRDAIQKAYKAMGLTAEDADKVINGWK